MFACEKCGSDAIDYEQRRMAFWGGARASLCNPCGNELVADMLAEMKECGARTHALEMKAMAFIREWLQKKK